MNARVGLQQHVHHASTTYTGAIDDESPYNTQDVANNFITNKLGIRCHLHIPPAPAAADARNARAAEAR